MASEVPVAFEEAGDGEALVLLHGVGTDRHVWSRVMPALSARRRVIALDLPGFGGSPPAGEGFHLDAVAEVVGEAARSVAGGRYDLLGHSLGGAIAARVARRGPAEVRHLILFAPAGMTPRGRAVSKAAGVVGDRLLAARRAVGPTLARSDRGRRAVLLGAVHDPSRLSAEDARMMVAASRRARRLRPALEAALGSDVHPILAAVHGPIGLMWGERDRAISIPVAEALAASRPGAVVERIPDAGHVAQLEQPEAVVTAVERLLDRLGSITDS